MKIRFAQYRWRDGEPVPGTCDLPGVIGQRATKLREAGARFIIETLLPERDEFAFVCICPRLVDNPNYPLLAALRCKRDSDAGMQSAVERMVEDAWRKWEELIKLVDYGEHLVPGNGINEPDSYTEPDPLEEPAWLTEAPEEARCR